MQRETKICIIGAIIAVFLQVVVAPNIAIFQVMPNFLIVYTLVVAMLFSDDSVLIIAFVLGFVSDLLGYGPVGSLAFLLVLASFFASRAHAAFANGTVLMPLVILMLFALVVDVLYAAFLLGLSSNLNPIEAFAYRAVPCALYDCVVGLLMYPLLSRLLTNSQLQMKSVSRLR
ncbi:rod shape-determining protein MreD [Denitrobacterium detoxificans]|jgi:rod shape-determining protein MreD|uniref:rod shape-determining protein MreD n=1 Tax=Denitrobacterium detoxificans TaxID=79604 RepID=UPI0026E96741|nr:rod shape-determining protein MreD [Denitrobacterium detoxificans]MBE6465968.1 rod shape-determining protein MreD [Denitrobacterium detoxificans]